MMKCDWCGQETDVVEDFVSGPGELRKTCPRCFRQLSIAMHVFAVAVIVIMVCLIYVTLRELDSRETRKGSETMSDLMRTKQEGVYEVMCGSRIEKTIEEAIETAKKEGRDITFEFNGVTVTVARGSDPTIIYRDWDRALKGYIEKRVGPFPRVYLTTDEIKSDKAKEAENQWKAEERRRKAEAEEKAKAEAVERKLLGAAGMEFSDKAAWDEGLKNNTDPYGACVYRYAERWARLMQLEMAGDKPLESIAKETSHEADTEGITGFMYGCAVMVLSKVWIHGEQLRRWHNLDLQLKDEGEKANESGGVLNPAMLVVKG